MSSSSLFCAVAAPVFPVAFSPREGSALADRLAAVPKLPAVTPASRLTIRPLPEMVSSGVPELDRLTAGLPRGCLTEICGPASSGCSSVLLAALAAATQRQEVCALVDASDSLDPISAAAAGIDFERMLWVRCDTGEDAHTRIEKASDRIKKRLSPNPLMVPVEQALRVTDLLLQSAGFGLVILDLGGIPFRAARRVPLTTWFRFQRAVENTPTVLLTVTEAPCAQTCASLLLRLQSSFVTRVSSGNETAPAHAQVFEGLQIQGELLRSRLHRHLEAAVSPQRKPAQSVKTAFTTQMMKIS
ncbi:MAG TPA: hypothetical protein VFA68_06275 [Terriglobales bacterium]|nr:hypothetical protein [Terriglobales bacterium]